MINHWEIGNTLNLGYYPKDQTMQFSLYDSDNEDNWKKVKDTKFLGREQWSEDSFDYKYNAQGFRSDWDFDPSVDNPILLALGCSHTVGVGIPWNSVWCHQLGQNHYQDHIVWNAGLGGGSSDTVARLAVNMIPIAKPKTVAILWPSLHRFETYPTDSRCLWDADSEKNGFKGIWNTSSRDPRFIEEDIYNNQCKNKTIIKLLQEQYKFDLLELEDNIFEKYSGASLPNLFKKARDGTHMGTAWHWQLQEDMWSKYQ